MPIVPITTRFGVRCWIVVQPTRLPLICFPPVMLTSHCAIRLNRTLAALTCAFALLTTNADAETHADVNAVDSSHAEPIELLSAPDSTSISDSSSITAEATSTEQAKDRFWLVNTRGMSSDTCRANLQNPNFRFRRMYCGRPSEPTTLDDYVARLGEGRRVVMYVHGNRLDHCDAVKRSNIIYRNIRCRCGDGPIDWVLFSWPASKQGTLIHDFREKAGRTDAQGLYLAWLLRKHVDGSMPTALIGYSFGARVVTGSLHALAGGRLGGRKLPGEAVVGANFDAGLVAPALESHWMEPRGYHGRATKNLDRLVVLYNRRDAVLKRYWLLDRVRSNVALGYSGPKAFGPRADGSRLSVRARDCARFVGLQHDEVDYYTSPCGAGRDMANLIHDTTITH